MIVLCCNAGSTSLKFKLFDMPKENALAESKIERVGSVDNAIFHYENCSAGKKIVLNEQRIPDYSTGIRLFLDYLIDDELGVLKTADEIERVGFKTVLAKNFYGIHELTEEVLDAMKTYMVVAPAHNGPYLEAIAQLRSVLPDTMFVGAFETAFHTTIPAERKMFGIPYDWYEKYGVQRMGYHGASHGYIAQRVAAARGGKTGKLVSCHLGGSGSVCAIDDGQSVDTSFGFSLQTGLIHSNRVGDMDSFVIPYLISCGLTLEQVVEGLSKKGGLLGISGVSNDLRYVQEAAENGNTRAKLALDVYCNDIVKYIGSYFAEMGGLDCVVFTGGIGENAKYIRKAVCDKIRHMGIDLDDTRNSKIPENGVISRDDSPVTVYVLATNEELVVAKKTYEY